MKRWMIISKSKINQSRGEKKNEMKRIASLTKMEPETKKQGRRIVHNL